MNRPLSSSEGPRETAPAPKTQEPETADKVEHPHAHFEHPAEVVIDPLLSKDEKVRALEGMEQDARQLATAAAEGMTGGGGSDLQDVLVAKEALELPPFDLAVSVVLQSFRARLQSTEGSEAHALIARAIEAVEAASGPIGSAAVES